MLHFTRIAVLAACAIVAVSCSRPAPESAGGKPLAPRLKNLGDLHFAITTRSPDAQAFFNQGLTLVYGFNHAEALRSFKETARLDPGCAMAWWGQALALAPNINDSAIGPDREQQGQTAIAEALKRRGAASEREQALIDALAARFTAAEPDRARLNRAYADAMKSAYARFPNEPDFATLYADAVMNVSPWDYWKDNQPKPGIAEARAALEKAIGESPGHPGAHHIYIHLIEASDDVDRAIPSAEKLGSLVPAAGHLVHMPSHVFIRVGRYDDASAANEKAVLADEDYIAQCRAQGMYPAAYYPHNIHFLNATLVFSGRSKEAIDAAGKVASRHEDHSLHEPGFGFAHLLRTIPEMTFIRFGKWNEIVARPRAAAGSPYVQAMDHFARGFALANLGRLPDAANELKALKAAAANPELAKLSVFDVNTLDKLAAIGLAMLEGEIALRKRQFPTAIAAYRRAVELEDALRYSEPPDWMLPPRQFLGAAQLAAGQYAGAEATFRADLKRHRNNGWSLAGLTQALEKQAKAGEASAARAQFEKAWARADVSITTSRL